MIGVGLVIAVAIDATIVRGLLVPAAMRLMGDANWWAPAPLRRVYDRLMSASARCCAGRRAGADRRARLTRQA